MTIGESKLSLNLCAVGDVMPNREAPEKFFDHCAGVLGRFDIRMCQLETNFSERGSRGTASRGPARAHPRNAAALKAGGFDVVNYASNHTLDWGVEAMTDTIELLHQNGILVVGAANTVVQAREPVILERQGVRLAFLDFCSILPFGHWVDESRPGIAPLRIRTLYEMLEPNQPGCPPVIFTYPNEEDLSAMLAAVGKARQTADVVVLSLHWGLHFVPVRLAAYQRPVAHAAIDAGADIIIGTHPHILKGIEVYRGKPVFYSLGNFALDSNFRTWPNLTRWQQQLLKTHDWVIDPDWAHTYPYPEAARKTIAVRCTVENKRIERVSFLPAIIDRDARPRILSRQDREFDEVAAYMKSITEEAGLNARFMVEGDEVVIFTGNESPA
ncbi:MAG: CapA family protein [Pseudomonadota bacterium]